MPKKYKLLPPVSIASACCITLWLFNYSQDNLMLVTEAGYFFCILLTMLSLKLPADFRRTSVNMNLGVIASHIAYCWLLLFYAMEDKDLEKELYMKICSLVICLAGAAGFLGSAGIQSMVLVWACYWLSKRLALDFDLLLGRDFKGFFRQIAGADVEDKSFLFILSLLTLLSIGQWISKTLHNKKSRKK